MEFQAIIFAGGKGSRMLDLTSKIPKPLIMVANKPLIWYPVNYIERAGFEEVTIVTLTSLKDDIYRALVEENDVQISLDIIGINQDLEWGTADSLRYLADKIKCDNIMIFSCDTICNIPLQLLANVHRIKNSCLTMLLTQKPTQTQESILGPKTIVKLEKEIIGLNEENQVLIFGSEADFEESITLTHGFLINNPDFNILTTLIDCHIYIMKRWIIKYLSEKRKISSIKGELIPKLIKDSSKLKISTYHQNPSVIKPITPQSPELTENPLTIENDVQARLISMEDSASISPTKSIGLAGDDHNREGDFATQKYLDLFYKATAINTITDNTNGLTKSHVPKLYAYVHDETNNACIRVHTFPEYCLANKLVAKNPSFYLDDQLTSTKYTFSPDQNTHISNDSLVDQGCTFKENVNIKKSIIGKHCTFEANVKITNCIIGNHVIFKESSTVTNSVILNNCEFGKHCDIKDSFVSCGQNLPDKSKINNEEILDRVFMEI